MMDMQYFLDSSVIMYAAGKAHEYKEPCRHLIARIERRELEVVTSTEVIQEILYRYDRIRRKDEGIRLANTTLDLIPLLPVDDHALRRAIEIFKGALVEARDALHAAVALHFGIDHIISADRHFDLIKAITRIDPKELA